MPRPMKNRTTVERKSEREILITRTFNGPARIVFEEGHEVIDRGVGRLAIHRAEDN